MTAGRLRRAFRRRWVRVTAGACVLVLVATGCGVGWLAWRYAQVDRVHFAEGVLEDEAVAEPRNVLIVGSDSRAFVEDPREREAYGSPDEVQEERADSILLARAFPDGRRVALLSFPRDLWVPISPEGEEDRINTAIQGPDGPRRLIETINSTFGIPIHHFVAVDFRGFKSLVDAVGGVEVYFPAPVRDWDPVERNNPTGLVIEEPGCVRLDGGAALAYVRARHYQQLVDGEWQPDPAGDLNRINRQQEFLRQTLRQAIDTGLLDPRRLDGVVTAAVRHLTIDQNLGLRDLLRLGRQFRRLEPQSLQSYALPTTPFRTRGGADVLRVDDEAAAPILDVFRGVVDAPASLVPSSVRVRVLDGAKGEGTVRAAAFRLAAAGFVVEGMGESGAGVRPVRTVVRYAPGQEAKAALVARHLVAGADLVEDLTLGTVDAELVLGADFAGVTDPSTASAGAAVPPPPPPSSSAPPTTGAPAPAPDPAPEPRC